MEPSPSAPECAEEPVYAFHKVNAALWGIPVPPPASADRGGGAAPAIVSAEAAAAAAAAERACFERGWDAELHRLRPGAEEHGGLLSRCFFSWLNPFIALALKEQLDENSFPTPLRAHRARLCGSRLSAALRDGELRGGLHAWWRYVEPTTLVDGAVSCRGNDLARVAYRGACARDGDVGRLRWVGCVRASDSPERVYAGVEWADSDCVPAYRGAGAGCAGVHDGVVHGERLFHQVRCGAPCCTLEPVEDVELLGPRAAVGGAADGDSDDAGTAAKRASASTVDAPLPRAPSLFWTLLRTFKTESIDVLAVSLLSANCTTFTPVLLERSIAFIQSTGSGARHNSGGVLVLLTFAALKLAQPLIENKFTQLSNRVSSMFRSAVLSLLFEKCITVDPQALADPEISPGRILTMASSDVENVKSFPRFAANVLLAPYILLFNFVYLSYLVGWSVLTAVAVFVVALPIQAYLTQLQGSIMKELNACTDRRLRATNELFSGIRVVKTMGWEPRFLQVIQESRQAELRQRRLLQFMETALSVAVDTLSMFIVAAVLVTYTLSGHELTPSVAFPVISVSATMTWPLMLVPMVLSSCVKTYVSAQRIQRFLQCDDQQLAVKMFDSPAAASAEQRSPPPSVWKDDAIVFSHATMTARVKTLLPPCASVQRDVGVVGGLWRRVSQRIPCLASPRVPVELEWEPCGGDAHGVAVAGTAASADSGSGDGDSADAGDELYAMEPRAVLRDVSVRIPRGALTVVVGATGSGKSSLLASVLGAFAVAADGGGVWASSNIAYVPQQPWIMQATIRENIVFYDDRAAAGGVAAGGEDDDAAFVEVATWRSPLCTLRRRRRRCCAGARGGGVCGDDERMRAVVRCCQLETDLAELSGGLETEIGERGINLSGGQKARVSLARAVYADRDVYLLDDPLSALDAHVGKRVLQDVVLGALRGKTCVLATHHLDALPSAACVVVMDGGRCVFSGSYAEYAASEWRTHLERVETAPATTEEGGNDFSPVAPQPEGDFDVAATGAGGDGAGADAVEPTAESARYVADAYSSGASSSDECCAVSAKASTRCASTVPCADATTDTADGAPAAATLIVAEEKESGHVPWSVYKRFFEYAGGKWTVVVLMLCFLVTETALNMIMIWLSLWSTNYFPSLSSNQYLAVYLGIMITGVLLGVLRSLFFYEVMLVAMRELHQRMLFSVASAKVSFFDTTPIGRVLNRFTKDVYTMDEEVVREALFCFSIAFFPFEALIITAFSTPPAIIAIVVAIFFFGKMLVFYARILREVRRRGNVASSPMFSLLEEVGGGRETIAAYNKAHVLFDEAMKRLDKLYGTYYMERMMNVWMNIRVQYCGAGILVAVLTLAVLQKIFFPETFTPGRVALYSLSITMTLDLCWSLPVVVIEAALMEACFSSVQRMEHYIDEVDHEELGFVPLAGAGGEPATDVAVTSPAATAVDRASRGSLEFRHVDMRYREGLPLVLRDVSFVIRPREKIGVVGRTGSGKSTLLQTFMRLVEICGGHMFVNGVDGQAYELRELRRLFSMIPQDPLLFKGTVRSNVDPFGESSDGEIARALALVGVSGGAGGGGDGDGGAGDAVSIDAAVTEGGKNFSVGQRQLLCLARALLKKGSDFILMDEATANIDPVLDRQVQDVVRTSFSEYTVVTIAHRLHTVASYDRVLVMQHGELVEQGRPRDLVSDHTSLFYRMVAQGAAVARVDGAHGDETCEGGGGGGAGADAGAAAHEARVALVVADFLRACQP